MNTPGSVGYGLVALTLATGVGYYLAKGVNEERWKDHRARGLRTDKIDWKQKIEEDEARMAASKAASDASGSAPGAAAGTGGTATSS